MKRNKGFIENKIAIELFISKFETKNQLNKSFLNTPLVVAGKALWFVSMNYTQNRWKPPDSKQKDPIEKEPNPDEGQHAQSETFPKVCVFLKKEKDNVTWNQFDF